MREIKFRIWDGQCFRGNLKKYFLNLHDGQISEVAYSDLYDEYYDASERGSKLIIQQSTGLLDKNGKEIYEGDIIQLTTGETGIVKFENGCFYHNAKSDVNGQIYWNEVIGNIFENSELLKA